MSLNKKVLAAAIVSGLFATSANAAVTLGTTPTTTPVTIATEAFGTADTNGTATFANAATALDIVSPFNYSFSQGEVRYARVECSSNVKFATAAVTSNADASNVFGAVNGVGTNAIYFSVTAGATPVTAANTFTIDGTRTITNGAAASCTYSLYDQPSQAQAGGATGRIATTSGAYVAFASGYRFATNSQQELVANVEAANGAFTAFTAAGPVSATLGRLTALRHDAAAGDQIDEDGLDITLADIFHANTSISVAGDFSFVADAGSFTTPAALGRVFLASDATCATLVQAASSVSATGATFVIGNAARNAGADVYLCVTPNTASAIPAGSYTATLNAVVNDATEYNVASTGPLAAGSIVRNGTELQAPLAQVPTGWLSRMVLTNTGGIARPYTIRVLGETGNTIGTANLTGNVPANGTTVVDLTTVLTSFTASPRATLVVTVAGPNNQIQGLYQIVNPDKGSISNHAMIRPGTN